jgi:hypothetical protein
MSSLCAASPAAAVYIEPCFLCYLCSVLREVICSTGLTDEALSTAFSLPPSIAPEQDAHVAVRQFLQIIYEPAAERVKEELDWYDDLGVKQALIRLAGKLDCKTVVQVGFAINLGSFLYFLSKPATHRLAWQALWIIL